MYSRCVLLSCLFLACAAAQTATEAPLHPFLRERSGDAYQGVLDKARLNALALRVPPLSLLNDPRFAEAKAVIEAELAKSQGDDGGISIDPISVLYGMLRNDGSDTVVAMRVPGDFDASDTGNILVVADMASQAEDWQPLIEAAQTDIAEDRVRREQGAVHRFGPKLFRELPDLSVHDGYCVMRLGQPLPALPPFADGMQPQDGPPLRFRTRTEALMHRLLALAADDSEWELVLHSFPGWRTQAPRISGHIGGDERWQGMVRIAHSDLPLRPLAVSLRQRVRPGQAWTAALAYSRDTVLKRYRTCTLEAGIDTEAPIQRLEALLEAIQGDVLIQGRWELGPIPVVHAWLTVQDQELLRSWITEMGSHLGINERAIDGVPHAWSLSTPVGMVHILLDDAHCLITNSSVVDANSLAAVAGAELLAEQTVLALDVDVPSIVQAFVPMIYAPLQQLDEPLGPDPLAGFRSLSWDIANHLAEAAELDVDDEGETTDTSSPVIPLISSILDEDEHGWMMRRLEERFPAYHGAIGELLDRHAAAYRLSHDEEFPRVAIVVRSDRGYQILGGFGGRLHGQFPEGPIDEATLRATSADWQRVMGREATALDVLTVPQRPRFDRRWLPDQLLLVDHLPAYQARVLQQGDELVIAEEGLPLVAAAASGFGFGLAQMAVMLDWRYERIINERKANELRQQHAQLVSAVEAIAAALQTIRAADEEVPERCSLLVDQGHLELQQVRGFFAGVVPKDAAVLDRIGVWQNESDEWAGATFVVGIGDGWSISATSWGRVEVSQRYPEAPEIPDDLEVEPAEDQEAPAVDDF